MSIALQHMDNITNLIVPIELQSDAHPVVCRVKGPQFCYGSPNTLWLESKPFMLVALEQLKNSGEKQVHAEGRR